jgi:hypothetical protein
LTVSECLERYIAQRSNPDTRDKYRRTVRLHIAPTLGKIRINKLPTEEVQLWLNSLSGSGHYIEHVHMVLKVALTAAIARRDSNKSRPQVLAHGPERRPAPAHTQQA